MRKKPHYPFLYSWDKQSLAKSEFGEKPTSRAHVNRERKIELKSDYAISSVKKGITSSLIIASLILSLELVLYLGRNRIMP